MQLWFTWLVVILGVSPGNVVLTGSSGEKLLAGVLLTASQVWWQAGPADTNLLEPVLAGLCSSMDCCRINLAL